jgi:hypothetical protein
MNGKVPHFHVLRETPILPRLHCFHCSQLNGTFDYHHQHSSLGTGENGGGNFAVDMGAIDSWFFNHKQYSLFYETHVKSASCAPVPPAQQPFPAACFSSPTTLSLTDGIGYDLYKSRLCSVDDKMLAEQKKSTHMKDYHSFREVIKKVC